MRYDLIIIGGGMSGISVAHFFRHRKILLLEKGQLLCEASGKNAGFVISGFGEHFSNTAGRWGVDRACEVQQIHLRNHERIRQLVRSMPDSEYRQTGSFSIAENEKELQVLRESYTMLRRNGFEVDWIDRASVGLATSEALFSRQDASINPQKFWSYLASGVPVKTECEVVRVQALSDGNVVETTSGKFETKFVVYCLNAFTSNLLPEAGRRIIPLRGQTVELPIRGVPPTFAPVIRNYGEVYWRFSGSTLIFGGLEYLAPEEETGVAGTVSEKLRKLQLDWIAQHFSGALIDPGSEGVARCSTMAFTVDGFPFVGPLAEKNQYILAGLCGLGHGYALECASWLYEWIERGRNTIPPYCSSDRILRLPVYTEGNWRILYEAWNH